MEMSFGPGVGGFEPMSVKVTVARTVLPNIMATAIASASMELCFIGFF